MDTPIYDFAEKYSRSGTVRAHMPGHKGFALLGCEALDITEIMGRTSFTARRVYCPKREERKQAFRLSGYVLFNRRLKPMHTRHARACPV